MENNLAAIDMIQGTGVIGCSETWFDERNVSKLQLR